MARKARRCCLCSKMTRDYTAPRSRGEQQKFYGTCCVPAPAARNLVDTLIAAKQALLSTDPELAERLTQFLPVCV